MFEIWVYTQLDLPKKKIPMLQSWLICFDRYFDYLFYIDFEASMADPRAQYALGHLQVSLL